MNTGPVDGRTVVTVPGHGRFHATAEALEMIAVFGGSLHCYQGSGGSRDSTSPGHGQKSTSPAHWTPLPRRARS